MADASKPKPPTPNPPPQPGSSGLPPGFIPVAEISYYGKKQGGATSLHATVDWKSPGDINITTGAPGARCQVNLTEQQRRILDEAFQNASDVLSDAATTIRDAMPF